MYAVNLFGLYITYIWETSKKAKVKFGNMIEEKDEKEKTNTPPQKKIIEVITVFFILFYMEVLLFFLLFYMEVLLSFFPDFYYDRWATISRLENN